MLKYQTDAQEIWTETYRHALLSYVIEPQQIKSKFGTVIYKVKISGRFAVDNSGRIITPPGWEGNVLLCVFFLHKRRRVLFEPFVPYEWPDDTPPDSINGGVVLDESTQLYFEGTCYDDMYPEPGFVISLYYNIDI